MDKRDRWQQRLQNLNSAFQRLTDACDKEVYSELEIAGLIQTYEFTFELGWKTLKEKLSFEGYEVNSPRSAILQAYKMGLLPDASIWLKALESRNLFSHAYSNQIAEQAVELIRDQFYPMLSQVVQQLNDSDLPNE